MTVSEEEYLEDRKESGDKHIPVTPDEEEEWEENRFNLGNERDTNE